MTVLGNRPTSNPGPPFPITPLSPFTNSPVSPSSCSMLLTQSSFPVQKMTCSEYAAIVFNSGVLRSMSRSGGVAAHSQLGDGHDCVYGIAVWKRVRVVEKERKARGMTAREIRVKDMLRSWRARFLGALWKLYGRFGKHSAMMTRSRGITVH